MDTIRGLKSESMGGFSITGITMVVMVIATVAMVVLWPPGKTTAALPIEQVDEELVAITNKISKAFSSNEQRWRYYNNCIVRTGSIIGSETNRLRRQVIARHLMHEFCSFEFSGEDIESWEKFTCDYENLLCGMLNAISGEVLDDKERWEFIFDALQHYKNECIATLDEPKVEPDERDRRIGGCGVRWRQRMRKNFTKDCFSKYPARIDWMFFQREYPKLSPELKKYFRKRFREVFCIDYIPNSRTNPRFLWGDGNRGTKWQGEGLEWRVVEGDAVKVLDPKEYWEKNKED